MIITKTDFIKELTRSNSLFLGVMEGDGVDLYRLRNNVGDIVNNANIKDYRKAVKNGKYIRFSDGSLLDLNNNEFTSYKVYKHDFELEECTVYEVEIRSILSDGEVFTKYMYYLVKGV